MSHDMIRLSVGIEDIDDIINDFEDGFRAAKKPRLIANVPEKLAAVALNSAGKFSNIIKCVTLFCHYPNFLSLSVQTFDLPAFLNLSVGKNIAISSSSFSI